MKITHDNELPRNMAKFDRAFFDPEQRLKYIGAGGIGGKARGLSSAAQIVSARISHDRFPGIDIRVPSLTVLRTSVFDALLDRNDLRLGVLADLSDDAIARAFQRADFPAEALGDLRALVDQVRSPLAIRSSSLLEDSLAEPFAGVYETKMIPNNQPSPDDRFRRLIEAIKLVYASTFFRRARTYLAATKRSPAEEKMAVVIQEVVGRRFRDRFYPALSGVARSWNYYATGASRPEDGVVNLALGLGKTIVDGGICWTYSPASPASPPPFASAADLVACTQSRFWSINMGKPPAWDPIRETEYLLEPSLSEAEQDGTLTLLASTYDAHSGRISPGLGTKGPRVLDFAMLLVYNQVPVNDLVVHLLKESERELACPVEIEFAMTFEPHELGFLQVRPMSVSSDTIEVGEGALSGPDVLVSSRRVLGNGAIDGLHDIVYVKPDLFEAKYTREIAGQLERVNMELVREGTPYVLIGFGRWGSSDPWLGIPVEWPQISGARVVVEAMLEGMNVELSQGSHFFHNLTSFHVPYFSVPLRSDATVDWAWLDRQPVAKEFDLVKHVVTATPLSIRVDGRTGRGVVRRGDAEG